MFRFFVTHLPFSFLSEIFNVHCGSAPLTVLVLQYPKVVDEHDEHGRNYWELDKSIIMT